MIGYGPQYVSPNDFHRRRPGEPLGHVPTVGELITYALRHNRPGDDTIGPWSGPAVVRGIHRRAGNDFDTYWLSNPARPNDETGWSWMDLQWWVCKRHIEDGALF